MADMVINDTEAQAWLRGHVERAGGLSKFCQRVGVSKPLVSAMQNGKKPITGRVAKMIGLQRINYYELTKVVASPEQERYENSRREWLEQNPTITKEALELARAVEEAGDIARALLQKPAK
jgi:hypothetical protein